MGYKLETTALISKWNYNVFRIRCIMLILEIFNSSCLDAQQHILDTHQND